MEPHERMKEIQTDSDDKIRALAVKLGVNEHNLSNYLNGTRSVPYDVLVRFADFYRVSADYLLGRTDIPEPPMTLSPAERAMVEEFRTLSREQRKLVRQMIHFMREQNP